MAPQEFPLFITLPAEIRRAIYLLATPPRVVELVEEGPRDESAVWEFMARVAKGPARVKLDPSIMHFAFILEDYDPTCKAFSIPETENCPGDSSPPELSRNWLRQHHELAWAYLRKSYVRSKAPVPPLLHACRESRGELMRYGYELAFRTRSSGPRTWFHFERDTHYFEVGAEDASALFLDCCGLFDATQLHVQDLRRVRKLVLSQSATNILSWGDSVRKLDIWIRIYPELSELLLGEWDWGVGMNCGTPRLNKRKNQDPFFCPKLDAGRVTARHPRHCVAVEEVDALFELFGNPDLGVCSMLLTGRFGHLLRKYKMDGGDGRASYFDVRVAEMRRLLLDKQKSLMSRPDTATAYSPWKIPDLKLVHVLYSSQLDWLVKQRHDTWEAFCKAKKAWKDMQVHPHQTSDESKSPTLPFDLGDEDAIADSYRQHPVDPNRHRCLACSRPCSHFRNYIGRWWIEHGDIPKPSVVQLIC